MGVLNDLRGRSSVAAATITANVTNTAATTFVAPAGIVIDVPNEALLEDPFAENVPVLALQTGVYLMMETGNLFATQQFGVFLILRNAAACSLRDNSIVVLR